jgi:FKBP-type peptidyl-prolyl cis-trans isomerase (trigger factor)
LGVRVEQRETEDRQIVLDIEASDEEIEDGLKEVYLRLVSKTNIPGFRKGKVPRPILERHIGKESFLEKGAEIILPRLYSRAIEEGGIEPLAQPKLEVLSVEPQLKFRATVPLKPEVVLGDYRGIRMEQTEDKFEDQVVDKLVEISRVEFPPFLREEEISRLLRREMEGFGTFQNYLSFVAKSEEEVMEELRPEAEGRIKRTLVLGKVAEEENLRVEEEEVEAELEKKVEDLKEREKAKRLLWNWLERVVLTRKTIDLLVEIAKGGRDDKSDNSHCDRGDKRE